jgi:hypothetical protein
LWSVIENRNVGTIDAMLVAYILGIALLAGMRLTDFASLAGGGGVLLVSIVFCVGAAVAKVAVRARDPGIVITDWQRCWFYSDGAETFYYVARTGDVWTLQAGGVYIRSRLVKLREWAIPIVVSIMVRSSANRRTDSGVEVMAADGKSVIARGREGQRPGLVIKRSTGMRLGALAVMVTGVISTFVAGLYLMGGGAGKSAGLCAASFLALCIVFWLIRRRRGSVLVSDRKTFVFLVCGGKALYIERQNERRGEGEWDGRERQGTRCGTRSLARIADAILTAWQSEARR